MDLNIEQSLASVVRYIQNKADNNSALYFDNIPEDYIVPALYFPVPHTTSKKMTFDTYLTTIYLNIQFMASSEWLSYIDAAKVRDCILFDDCRIDIMNKDGSLSGKKIKVTDLDVNNVDDGIVKLSFAIQNYFSNLSDFEIKANSYKFSGLIKPDTLYDAWLKATNKLRENEEVQKECLRKAIQRLQKL